jgi:hypothetical protein
MSKPERKRSHESKRPRTLDENISIGVKKAQVEMQRRGGPKKDEAVAHPDDNITYGFRRAEGVVGIVYLPANFTADGKEIEKQFPLNELFSPNEARAFAIEAMVESEQNQTLH